MSSFISLKMNIQFKKTGDKRKSFMNTCLTARSILEKEGKIKEDQPAILMKCETCLDNH